MIVSFTAVHIGGGAWRLEWASDQAGPTYRLYRDGALLARTTATSWIVPAGPEVYDVFDAEPDRPPSAFPGYLALTWHAPAGGGVDRYRIEQWDGTAWIARGEVRQDERTYYRWTSGTLADDATHAFRVVAVGAGGNAAPAAELSALMVRHPDAPAATWSYADGTVTIV